MVVAALVPFVSVTVGFDTVTELRPVAGFQLYASPAVAAVPSVPGLAVQRSRSGPAFDTGTGLMVTVATAVDVQPAVLPVTVYVVVDAGDAAAVVAPEGVAPALQV